jgi:tagatose-6-phosphate ketose/aldose isomerase
MSSAMLDLLNLSDSEKKRQGVEFTPREIAQQPATWAKAVEIMRKQKDQILRFMADAGMTGERQATIYLTGAGTSEFVGTAVANVLRKGFGRNVQSVPTTHFVTHAADYFVPGQPYVLVSFARSGNSPESMATFNFVKKVAPQTRHLVITCNKNGKLAKAAQADPSALYIQLPDETNDESLVMTSSFSTMAFTAIGLTLINDLDKLAKITEQIGKAGRRVVEIYSTMLKTFAQKPFKRACYLGSGVMFGTAQECMLKLQEMTEGRVATKHDSFLGLRHGPQVFVDDACVVIGLLSSEPYARRYELDMLKELKVKKQGCGMLVVCDKATPEIRELANEVVELFPDTPAVADDFRVMTDVMVGQTLGVFKSMSVGLKPDNPSTSGMINRVVQGVVIYDM